MRLLLTLTGVLFLALFVAACEQDVGKANQAMQKNLAAEEDALVEEMQKPETIDERRELRQRLADQQAQKIGELESAPIEEANPVKGEVPDETMDQVINEVMSNTGAAREDIKVLRSESLIFNDGSLGCGTPGQDYMQVQTPGYRIVLMHGRDRFDYRVTEKGYSMLCKQPSPPDPRGGGNAPVM